MLRVSNALRISSHAIRGVRLFSQANKALEDHDLLEILQSEIDHELTSEPSKHEVEERSFSILDVVYMWDVQEICTGDSLFKQLGFRRILVLWKMNQIDESGSLGDFVMEWDSPKSKDVFLRKKIRSGEEVAVSALLGSQIFDADSGFPAVTDVKMKVCIKKPGLSSILQFDCEVSGGGKKNFSFGIRNACYFQSAASFRPSLYRGRPFSDLDPQLQHELKKYLEARGIEESLLKFLLLHLQKKEQRQYVNWLQNLESAIV